MEQRYAHLLAPLRLPGLTLKNRLLAAPTSLAELGPGERYSKENIDYYRLKAAGGTALVTVGDVIVELDTGRSHPQQVGINDPAAAPGLVAVAEAIHAGGAAASVELDHGGALCAPEFLGGRNAIGPSGYVDRWGDTVEEMTEADMTRIADAFAQGTLNARAYGFDMVMVHMGHGWLLHQFLSPITNRRTDQYGGSLENRLRFPLMVLRAIRRAVGPSFPIEVRMSGSERFEGGYDLDTGIGIARAIDGLADLIHVSAGTQEDPYSAVLMHPGAFQSHGENSYLSAAIKPHVKTPVVTVGAFSQPDKMEEFLAGGHADAIAMARALIADPFLPKKLIRGQAGSIRPCLRCGECQSGMMKNGVLHCAVNPIIGREADFYHPIPTNRKRTVLIAGGGPAGCQAAIEAHARGHKVILCEKSDRLGGLGYAHGHGPKALIARYRDWLAEQVAQLPITLCLGREVTAETVAQFRPDALIIAIGAKPRTLPVPCDPAAPVLYAATMDETAPIGERVVVIGGGLVGCETAIDLAAKGHQVTILELQEELAPDCGRMHRIAVLHHVETAPNITAATRHRCTRIAAHGVHAADPAGKEVFFPADTVIMAAGMEPDREKVEALRALVPETYVVGDALRPRQIGQATRDAVNAVIDLGL